LNIRYDNQTYQVNLWGGPVPTTGPLGTPESSVGPTYYVTMADTSSCKKSFLMFLSICVAVPLGFVGIAAMLYFFCKVLERLPIIENGDY